MIGYMCFSFLCYFLKMIHLQRDETDILEVLGIKIFTDQSWLAHFQIISSKLFLWISHFGGDISVTLFRKVKKVKVI